MQAAESILSAAVVVPRLGGPEVMDVRRWEARHRIQAVD